MEIRVLGCGSGVYAGYLRGGCSVSSRIAALRFFPTGNLTARLPTLTSVSTCSSAVPPKSLIPPVNNARQQTGCGRSDTRCMGWHRHPTPHKHRIGGLPAGDEIRTSRPPGLFNDTMETRQAWPTFDKRRNGQCRPPTGAVHGHPREIRDGGHRSIPASVGWSTKPGQHLSSSPLATAERCSAQDEAGLRSDGLTVPFLSERGSRRSKQSGSPRM